MKLVSRLLIATALLATGGLVMAQPAHDHGRHGPHQQHNNHRNDRHGYDHHDHRRPVVVIHHDRRPPPRRHWQRGHRYAGPVYVVHDYGHYHLRQPPRGYHWVRADNNDYLLVAIATGIILDVALH